MPYLKDKNAVFPLGHFVLYTKGWYESTDDIFEDLKIVLRLDDYTPFTKFDVLSIIVNAYDKYFEFPLVDFLSSIQESEVWKHGYCTTNNHQYGTKTYDNQTAIIYKIMSELRFSERSMYKKVTPNYKEGLNRPKDITVQRILSAFNMNDKYLEWKEKNIKKVLEY